MDSDKRSNWLRKLDENARISVLPRQQLADDSEIMDFLLAYVASSHVCEDDYAAFVAIASKIRSTPNLPRPLRAKADRFRLRGDRRSSVPALTGY